MAASHGARRGGRKSSGDLETLIENFLGNRDNQRLSRSERDQCHQLLSSWRNTMEAIGVHEVAKIRRSHLKRWLETLDAEVSSLFASAFVRLLFVYAAQRHLLTAGRNPYEMLSAPLRLPEERMLSEESREALGVLDQIPADSFENIRDRVFLRMMQVSGTWLGGLVNLDLYDPGGLQHYVVLPEGVIRYRASSGQTVVAAADAKTMDWLDQWLAARTGLLGAPVAGPLWISRRGERVRRASMAPRIRKLAMKYGLE